MIKFPSGFADSPNGGSSGWSPSSSPADWQPDRGEPNPTGAMDLPVPSVLGSSRRGDDLNIGHTGGIDGARPITPSHARPTEPTKPTAPTEKTRSDQVEISQQARIRQKLAEAPAERTDRIAELKALIESGEYETDERIRGAVDRIVDESL